MRTSNSKTLLATTIFCLGGAITAQYAIAQKSDASNKTSSTGSSTAGSSSAGAGNTATKTSAADMKFAKEAAMGGLMEVELGKVATQKASNDKVKQFGQKMVDDHSKANDELKSVAAKNNITLPGELDAKHKGMVDKMSAMSGTAFDRAYMRDMVKDHTTDVAEFQKEANSGGNSDLKMFAGSTLPTLQQHLTLAKETDSSLTSTSSK